jgi:hypothetical protein
MKIRQLAFYLVFLSASLLPWHAVNAADADTDTETDSAKQWFVEQYAPVWKNTHSLDAQALAPLYHSQGLMRVGDELALWQNPASIEQLIQETKRQEWQSARLINVRPLKIGPTTESLNVVWQSDFKEQSAQISCEWYLLEKLEQQWKIIGHRYTEC